jgi:hypothetical protein
MNPILAHLTAADRKPITDRLDNAGTDTDRATVFLAAYDGTPPPDAFLELIAAGYGSGQAGPHGTDGKRWIIEMFGVTCQGADLRTACHEWTLAASDRTLTAARARVADPPGDDDASLLAAARNLYHLSPDPRERAEAGELMTWLTHTPYAEDAA